MHGGKRLSSDRIEYFGSEGADLAGGALKRKRTEDEGMEEGLEEGSREMSVSAGSDKAMS